MYELAEKASMHTCCEESFPKQDMRKIFEFHFPVLKSHLEKKKKKKEEEEGRKDKTSNTEAGLYSYSLLQDDPELCSLSLRKAPAYKMVVNLHYFQSIILWVCGKNQGTRCNKAQPSC